MYNLHHCALLFVLLLRKEELELVKVSVAVELAGDDVRVAADDGVEVGAPHPHAVHVARWDVAQDVHLPQDCCNSKMIAVQYPLTFSPFNSAS